MKSVRSMAVLALMLSAAALSGCQTSGAKNEQNRIRVTNGSFQGADGAISGDIQSILMAGGLDVSNPSSASASKAAAPQSVPGIPPSTQSLVAALSAADSGTKSMSAAQTPAQPAPSALAMVEEPKPKRRKVVFETRIEEERPETVELASINATGSSSMEDDAFDPLPPSPQTRKPVATAPIQKSERLARIPVNEKTSRVKRF